MTNQKKSEIWTPTGNLSSFRWDTHTKLIKEAASRRDIHIEKIDEKAFFLKHNGKSVFFMEHAPELTTVTARAAAIDKNTAKKFLERSGISVPKGESFLFSDLKKALAYAKKIGFPVVVKPISGTGGTGVTSNILDEEHFKSAWSNVKSGKCIVEKHIHGNDYRVMVVNGKFICAARRIPVNITGNGKLTVNQLIEEKNLERSKKPYIGSKKIKLNNEMLRTLKNLGYSEESVIPKDEFIQLVPVANIGTGGDSQDVTDDVHPKFAEICQRAAHAIPGIFFAGVDLLAPDISKDPEDQDYAICEINTRCDIGLHNFPVFGNPRDSAGSMLEEIFPDAKPVPLSLIKKVNLILRGSVINVGMRNRIQNLATLNHIKGWVKNEENEVLALLCGSESAVNRVIITLSSLDSVFVSTIDCNNIIIPDDFKIIK